MLKDVINSPAHYAYGNYEPIKVIYDWGLNFSLGSALKYICRAGHKDDAIQDLKKARKYLDFEIEERTRQLDEERCADD